MIDQADNLTQALPLEQKRGRGRPATGAAMTPAEKQKAYRERQAKRNTEPSMDLEKVKATAAHYIEKLERELESAKERAQQAEANFVTLREKLDKALTTITELKKGNVTQKESPLEIAVDLIQYDAQLWDNRKWVTIGKALPDYTPFDSWRHAEKFVKESKKKGSKRKFRIVPSNLPIIEYK